MKSSHSRRRGAATIVCAIALTLAAVGPSSAQDTEAAPRFDDGRMLRPLVQEVLQGSPLVDGCRTVADDPLGLACFFAGSGQTVDVDLEPLLSRLQAPQADPRAEILAFANAVLLAGDPDRIFPQRANLRPLVRAAQDVASLRSEEQVPEAAQFPVAGFPDLVAFPVRDDADTVHLIQSADDPVLGLPDFEAIMARALANARWTEDDRAKLRCRLAAGQDYCQVVLDGFYEASMVMSPGLAPWLAVRVGEPSLIAIPARDELLVARLSDQPALAALGKRLKQRSAYTITHSVASWDGTKDGMLQPVDRWDLRGGVLLPARLTIRLSDGTVISNGF